MKFLVSNYLGALQDAVSSEAMLPPCGTEINNVH